MASYGDMPQSALIEAAGIVVMARPDPLDRLALLERARCVVAGPGRELVDEVEGLGRLVNRCRHLP